MRRFADSPTCRHCCLQCFCQRINDDISGRMLDIYRVAYNALDRQVGCDVHLLNCLAKLQDYAVNVID